jgi:hypothetical protein
MLHETRREHGLTSAALSLAAALIFGGPSSLLAGAIGNPNAGNGWSSTAAISVSASSSRAGRPVIHTIDGSGIDASGSLHEGAPDGDPGTSMWRSGPVGSPVSRGGTVSGSHWIEFAFDQPYDLAPMWIWNYNEMPTDWTSQGMKEVTIEYSVTGSTDPADWITILDGTMPKVSEWIPEADPWNTPVTLVVNFGGARAKYVVITTDFGIERNWVGGGLGANEVGLSEVRFFTFKPPTLTNVEIGDQTALAFQSVVGKVYRPEYSMPASPNTWTSMGFTVLGAGGQMLVVDPDGYSTQKQYRILLNED